jgi:pheromone shutdown protein TraB
MFIFKWVIISGVLTLIGVNIGHAILAGFLLAFIDTMIESKPEIIIKEK